MGEQPATSPHPAMLIADDRRGVRPGPRSMPSRWPVLAAVARRSLPHLLEATVIPAILFYVLVVTVGTGVAMAAALGWTYGAVARRAAPRRSIPPLLLLATVGLTVRTLVGLLSGSTFVYFIQPVATTLALAAVFFGSVLVGRPLINRMAFDFCPLAPDVASRPGILRLFRGLTLLWAGVHATTAAATFGMLLSMPVATFVLLKTVTCLGITVLGIVLTVSWSVRTAGHEHLVFASQAPIMGVGDAGP